MAFHMPEKYRIKAGPMGSSENDGNNGAFVIPARMSQRLNVIASEGMGWEHVSVSRPDRCPTWGEMCDVKALFWDDEDCVVQYHPPKSEYVNNHPYCLHLWRPMGMQLPTPDSFLVGIK